MLKKLIEGELNMNSGERDELLIKLYLVAMRDNGDSLNGVQIKSVGFSGAEYLSIPEGISKDFSLLNENELTKLANIVGISKAGVFDKSDVYINGNGFSLKSFSAAPPALVNHTARPGFETACRYAGVDIKELDKLVDMYWDLRFKGIITEDIRNSNGNSPFRNAKSVIKPILEYFLFTGSGKGKSDYPAVYILDYFQPSNPATWHILSPSTAVDLIWDKLIFSLRAKKGMPLNYNKDTYCKLNAESIARWTQYHSGDYRGALHIRLTK